MKFKIVAICAALFGILLTPEFSQATLVFIVNSKNETKEVSRKFLADAFLKKITFWHNGEIILPIDLQVNSPVRNEFSEQILNRPVTAIRSYWQQMIFSGQSIPPVEYDHEEQVIRFVGGHANALGYVSDKAVLGPNVKAVPLK